MADFGLSGIAKNKALVFFFAASAVVQVFFSGLCCVMIYEGV